MSDTSLLNEVQAQLKSAGIDWQPESNCFDIVITSEKLLDAVKVLKTMQTFYLAAITGLDDGAEANTMQILYHFCNRAFVMTLRVTLERNQPHVPSICAVFPYASPFERETGEMFGITFTDTPDTSRLFLSDDWSDDVYPLRKDADLGEVQDDNRK
jgi:Ni,Fe-hydrogenase III component G